MRLPRTRITVEEIVDEKAETVSVIVHQGTLISEGHRIRRSATGTAKTAAPDKFEPEVGYKIALGRALRDLGRQNLKEGQEEVHAKDRIRQKQEEASRAALEAKKQRATYFPPVVQPSGLNTVAYKVSTRVVTPEELNKKNKKKKRLGLKR